MRIINVKQNISKGRSYLIEGRVINFPAFCDGRDHESERGHVRQGEVEDEAEDELDGRRPVAVNLAPVDEDSDDQRI